MPLPAENVATTAAPRKKNRGQFRQELTEEQKADIQEAFTLFDTNANGYITL